MKKLMEYIWESDFIGCIKGKAYKCGKEIRDSYMVTDETGEEYMYPKDHFKPIDGSEEENRKEYDKQLEFIGESFKYGCIKGKKYHCSGEAYNCYIIDDEFETGELYAKDQFKEIEV